VNTAYDKAIKKFINIPEIAVLAQYIDMYSPIVYDTIPTAQYYATVEHPPRINEIIKQSINPVKVGM